MFDNPNTKKDEKVDDIFADTDVPSTKEEKINVVPKQENKTTENKQEVVSVNKEESKKIEKFDESKLKQKNGKSWLKPVIIGVLIIVCAVVIYFVYGMFSGDDNNIALVPINNQEEEDFVPTSPDFVDPSLIIPDPINESEFITEEPEIEPEEEIIEEEIIEEEIIEEEIIEIYEINLLNHSFIDTDGDGLSDLAEEFIGTDPNNPDTDNDGFSDYDELINGYNPLGDGLLPDNFPALLYEDNNLSFYYSKNFIVQKIDNSSWSLIAPDGARINMERDYSDSDSIFDWYKDEFDNHSWIAENRQIVNIDMERAIISSDGKMIYILSNNTNNVFKIDLEISENNDFDYYLELALLVNTLIQK